jgi:hypothetical protein
MLRRERVLALGGYRQGAFPKDYDLWLRIAAAGGSMFKIDRILLRWRQHSQSLSRIDERYARVAFDALRARYLAADPRLHEAREVVIWGAGRRTGKRCQKLFEQGLQINAWIDIDPHKIGQRIANVPVYCPQWLRRPSHRSPRPLGAGVCREPWRARRNCGALIGDALPGGYRLSDGRMIVAKCSRCARWCEKAVQPTL